MSQETAKQVGNRH